MAEPQLEAGETDTEVATEPGSDAEADNDFDGQVAEGRPVAARLWLQHMPDLEALVLNALDRSKLSCFPVPGDAKRAPRLPMFVWDGSDSESQGEDNPEQQQRNGNDSPTQSVGMKQRLYWMPDKMCKVCYECETPFTMFRRRHHCRICGQVFCQSCSSHYLDGKDFGSPGFVRACHRCYSQHQAYAWRPPPRNPALQSGTASAGAGNKKELPQRGRLRRRRPRELLTRSTSMPTTLTARNGDQPFVEAPRSLDDDDLSDGSSLATLPLRRRHSSSDTDSDEEPQSSDGSLAMSPGAAESMGPTKDFPPEEDPLSPRKSTTGGGGYFAAAPPEQVAPTDSSKLSDFMVDLAENWEAPGSVRKHIEVLEKAAISHLEALVTQLLHICCGGGSVSDSRLEEWSQIVVTLVQQVVSTVDPNVRGGDHIDIRPYVKIKLIPGGTSGECRYVDGVVFRKNMVHKGMPQMISHPQLLLLSGGIEFQRDVSRISTFDTLLEQEERYTQILVDKIVSLRPDIVLVGKSVSRFAKDLLRKHGVVLIQNVKPALLQRIARMVGVNLFPSIDDVINESRMASSGQSHLGQCRQFRSESFPSPALESSVAKRPKRLNTAREEVELRANWLGERWIPPAFRRVRGHGTINYTFLEGCPKSLGCTVLLRGGSQSELKAIKRVVAFAVNAAYNLRLEVAYLNDRCAALPSSFSSVMSSAAMEEPAAGMGAAQGLDPFAPALPLPERLLLSSSLAVDLGCPPQADLAQGLRGTPFGHQSILLTTVWMTQKAQCCPFMVKIINYYTAEDMSLGRFLLHSCFNSQLKCQNVNCKRTVREHVLSFFHGEGRVDVTVSTLPFSLPAARLRPCEDKKEALAAAAAAADGGSASSSSTNVEGGMSPEVMRRMDKMQIFSWSYCTRCRRYVTPLVPLSDDAWKFSFGKFMEVTFYNSQARGRTGGCSHSIQQDHVLFYGCGGLVARFSHQSVQSYAVSTPGAISLEDSQAMALSSIIKSLTEEAASLFGGLRSSILEQLEVISGEALGGVPARHVVMRELHELHNEVAAITFSLVDAIADQPETVRLLPAVQESVLQFGQYLGIDVSSILRHHEDWRDEGRFEGEDVSELGLELEDLEQLPERSSERALKGSAEDGTQLLRFLLRFRRELYWRATNWNNRLKGAGQLLAAIEQYASASERSKSHDEHLRLHQALQKLEQLKASETAKLARAGMGEAGGVTENEIDDTVALLLDSMIARLEARAYVESIIDEVLDATISEGRRPQLLLSSDKEASLPSGCYSTMYSSVLELLQVLLDASTSGYPSEDRSLLAPPEYAMYPSVLGSLQFILLSAPGPVQGKGLGALRPVARGSTRASGRRSKQRSRNPSHSPVRSSPLAVSPLGGRIPPRPTRHSSAPLARSSRSLSPTQGGMTKPSAADRLGVGAGGRHGPGAVATLLLGAGALGDHSLSPMSSPRQALQNGPVSHQKKHITGLSEDVSGSFSRSLPGTPESSRWSRGLDDSAPGSTASSGMRPNVSMGLLSAGGLGVALPPGVIGSGSLHGSTKRESKRVSSRLNFQSALARFLSGGGWGDSGREWTVDLSPFEQGRPRLEPGRNGEFIPVYEEQPTSIIAYSLASKSYREQLRRFMTPPMQRDSGDPITPRHSSAATPTAMEYGSEMDGMQPLSFPDSPVVTAKGSLPPRPIIRSTSSVSVAGSLPDSTGLQLEREDSVTPSEATSPTIAEKAAQPDSDYSLLDDEAWWVMDTVPDSSFKLDELPSSSRFVAQPWAPARQRLRVDKSRPLAPLEAQLRSRVKSHIKHKFVDVDVSGNSTCKFVCNVYWGSQFEAVRLAHFWQSGNLDDVEDGFVRSLSMATKWDAKGGKSGATFSKTADSRFVIKHITKTELQMFLDFAPHYFEYLAMALFHGLPTALCKIVGVYQVGFHNRITGRRYMDQVVVMQNLFYGRSIGHVFDLKGSSRSRYVPVDRSPDPGGRAAGNPGVLLDENFREFTRGQPLPLVASSQALFHTAILNDTQFLSVVNIVDYSIVVGIDDDTHELVVGIIDYMRQYDIIKRVERMGKSVSMIAGQAEPTIIQPSLYKNRFRTAMERYFMAVPSPWSASKIQPAPEHRTAEVSA